ncbi:MAG: ATP-binding cassette domain-containing protein [Thermotogaceae bacterium]|nr:ATP-binding cassette domain-containing protein [Thermotogaceae bacterium]
MKVSFLNVWFKYDTTWVLKDVSLEFENGKMYLILGENGSGKSTFLKIMSGILRPSKGEILIDDEPVKDVWELRKRVGYVFQVPSSQIVGSTVEEDVAFALENMGLPRSKMVERVEWALSVVGLSDFKKEDPLNLSGGQKQRLAIASILAMSPDFLALDEPTSMLDPESKKEIMEVIKHLKKEGKGIILVTHDLEYVEGIDEAILLENGNVSFEGTLLDLFKMRPNSIDVPLKYDVLLECGKKID